MIKWIAEKNTRGGTRSQFVRNSRREIGITKTPENAEMIIRGDSTEKGKGRSTILKSFGRQNIEEIGCRFKSIGPIGGRKRGMKEKSTFNIINCTNQALGFAILGGCVWTREVKINPVT